MIKNLILSKTPEYLKLKGIKTQKIGKMITFDCMWCGKTANSIPGSINLNCLNCKIRFTLIDIVKKLEKKEGSDDEIIEYLKEQLKIDGVITKKAKIKTKELLDFYEEMGFDLVPVAKGEKFPIEKAWTSKTHKNKDEWDQWLNNSLNLGMKCGVNSNTTVVDIDTKEIPEELKKLLGDTLIQKTPHGWQYFYKFEKELPKTRIDEYKLDLENSGGQVVIEPSITDNQHRNFLELKHPTTMPEELKKFLLEKITVPRKTNSEKIKEDIATGDFKINPSDFLLKNNNLEGCCNSSFIKLGGILRKNLNLKQTTFVLQLLNRHLLENPMEDRTIGAMVQELDNYMAFDEQELAHEILEHVKEVKEITKSDLELSIAGEWTKGEIKKRFNKTIQYLIREEKITQRGKKIKIVEDLDWKDTLIDIGSPVNFKVPYLNDYAYFCAGDIVILGSKFGYGKCISEGMVLTNQGMKDIKEIGKYHPDGFSNVTKHCRIFSGKSKHKTYHRPHKFFKQTVDKTIKIVSNFGYELEGTLNHPIQIVKEVRNGKNFSRKIAFKMLGELTKEDKVIIVAPNRFPKELIHKHRPLKYIKSKYTTNIKPFTLPEYITPIIAKLLGYTIGDGHMDKNTLHIYQDKKETGIIDELKKIGTEIGIVPSINIYDNVAKISFSSAILCKFVRLKGFGLHGFKKHNLKSPDRYIPSYVLNSNRECQKAFIEAIFNCESSLRAFKCGTYQLEITMASKKLMSVLHLMLLNFGIISNLHEKKVKAYPGNKYWRIILPVQMTSKFFKIFKPIKYNHIKPFKVFSRPKKLRKIGNNQFIKDFYYVDTIRSITPLNETKEVYDFDMSGKWLKDKNHQFWSNGFVSHNSTLGINIIKRLVDQKIKPYYIYSEKQGGRFAKTATHLGLREGDFFSARCSNPDSIILRPNSIVIYDWVRPTKDESFARTDLLFDKLVEKAEKTNSFLICFVQLKMDDTFFAPNMIGQYPAVLAKYVHETNDGIYTKFVFEKIREPKMQGGGLEVPAIYDWKSKEVKLVSELSEEEQKGIIKKMEKIKK